MCKAALLSARVQSQLQHTTSLSGSELDQLMGNLDSWHEELPKLLSLPSVDFANIPISTGLKRPLLFMHMVHIGSRIIMHERTILANQPAWMAIPSNPSTTPQVFQLPKEIRHAYASSAQQLSRIIGVLYKNQCVLSRCWLTM